MAIPPLLVAEPDKIASKGIKFVYAYRYLWASVAITALTSTGDTQGQGSGDVHQISMRYQQLSYIR